MPLLHPSLSKTVQEVALVQVEVSEKIFDPESVLKKNRL